MSNYALLKLSKNTRDAMAGVIYRTLREAGVDEEFLTERVIVDVYGWHYYYGPSAPKGPAPIVLIKASDLALGLVAGAEGLSVTICKKAAKPQSGKGAA